MWLKYRKYIVLCFGALSLDAPGYPAIAATSPLTTEVIFEMGYGSSLVAGSYVPDMAFSLPQQVGLPFAPSIERIVKLGAQTVAIDPFYVPSGFYPAVKAAGLKSFEWRVTDVDSFVQTARAFAQQVFSEEKNAAVEKTALCLTQLGKPKSHFRFLALAWMDPPVVFGKTTFLGTLIERLGGENVAAFSIHETYPQVSEEWLMRTPVDVIYFLDELPSSRATAEHLSKRWWGEKRPELKSLLPKAFARPSMQPFHHLPLLQTGAKIPEACL